MKLFPNTRIAVVVLLALAIVTLSAAPVHVVANDSVNAEVCKQHTEQPLCDADTEHNCKFIAGIGGMVPDSCGVMKDSGGDNGGDNGGNGGDNGGKGGDNGGDNGSGNANKPACSVVGKWNTVMKVGDKTIKFASIFTDKGVASYTKMKNPVDSKFVETPGTDDKTHISFETPTGDNCDLESASYTVTWKDIKTCKEMTLAPDGNDTCRSRSQAWPPAGDQMGFHVELTLTRPSGGGGGSSPAAAIIVPLVLIIVVGGGVYYYLKVWKPAHAGGGGGGGVSSLQQSGSYEAPSATVSQA